MNKKEFIQFKRDTVKALRGVVHESNNKSLYSASLVSKESVEIINSLSRIELEMDWEELYL